MLESTHRALLALLLSCSRRSGRYCPASSGSRSAGGSPTTTRTTSCAAAPWRTTKEIAVLCPPVPRFSPCSRFVVGGGAGLSYPCILCTSTYTHHARAWLPLVRTPGHPPSLVRTRALPRARAQVCNAVEHDPNIMHMPMLAVTPKIFAKGPFWDTCALQLSNTTQHSLGRGDRVAHSHTRKGTRYEHSYKHTR